MFVHFLIKLNVASVSPVLKSSWKWQICEIILGSYVNLYCGCRGIKMHIFFPPTKHKGKVDNTYRIFSKYGPGVNYFQMASDQALNWTGRSFEIQKQCYKL